MRGMAILLCVLTGPQALVADTFQAGAARTEVTPPIGFPMWGYAARHDQASEGVLDPLQARALVLEVGKERLALVSLDLGRPPTRDSTARIRARVKEAVGIEHICLVASHTHHGPVLELDTWPTAKDPYVRQLEKKIADLIIEAAKALRPARLGVASKEVAFNRNRHSKRDEKPLDRELLILRVEDAEGKPIAHAVNFAAHPTMQDTKVRKFSADYVGALASLVEKETGVPCLFLQGAAGDVSANPGEEAGPEKFGQALGREVLTLTKTIHCTAPAEPVLTVREDDFKFASRIDLTDTTVRMLYSAAFFKELVAFYEREYRDGVRPHLTTALLDGEIGFVGVSGEFFCSHSLSLKRRARLEHVFFLGYCNDYQQYFPTIEAAAEGGYGADPAMAPAEPGAGERVIDQALVNLYKMRGKLPTIPLEKR